MTRSELAGAVTDAGFSELEIAVHFLWFRARFEGEPSTEPKEIGRFFSDHAISHPNLTRLRQRLGKDKRVLSAGSGLRLRLAATKALDGDYEGGKAQATDHPATGYVAGLLAHADKIKTQQTRSFVMEAIECVKGRSFRAAVLMSWCGALSLLQEHVFDNHLAAFNADALANGLLKKPIASLSDLRGALKESYFIEVLRRISVIDDSEKRSLKHCLDQRNNCGHPSALRLGEAAVADHLESLMLNVFDRYGRA